MDKINVRELMLAAALAAFSALTQLVHIGYQSPQWGMWIDIVAVSWIVSFFLFGLRVSLIVSLIGTIVITLFAPDTWLGASMKAIATLPLVVALFLNTKIRKTKLSEYAKPSSLIAPSIAGIAARCLIIVPLNYYYAIPIWTGMTTAQAFAAIPVYIIVIFNTLQSAIDVGLAWILVYKFKLSRYSQDKK